MTVLEVHLHHHLLLDTVEDKTRDSLEGMIPEDIRTPEGSLLDCHLEVLESDTRHRTTMYQPGVKS
jgi:hypothetical protein